MAEAKTNKVGKEYYQNIIIVFDDGVEVTATSKAFCFDEEQLNSLKIKQLMVTPPKEMPKGMSFERMEEGGG